MPDSIEPTPQIDLDAMARVLEGGVPEPDQEPVGDDSLGVDEPQGDPVAVPPIASEAESSGTGEEPQGADPQADEDAAPVAATLAVPLQDGTTHNLDVQSAQALLALGSWAQQLPPETREQFAAVESGQAVAIPRAEFEQFQAWKQTRRQSEPKDTYAELEDADIDPAIIARLRAQDQELANLRAAQQQPYVQQSQQLLDNRVAQYEAGVKSWADQRGITDQNTIEHLAAIALQSGVIPQFVERNRVYNPANGQLLQDADLSTVASQAMNFALAMNPELHSEVLTHQATAMPANQPSPATSQQIEQKKARAASLSTAPSTAVPSPSGQSTPRDLLTSIPAMAEMLTRRMNGDS